MMRGKTTSASSCAAVCGTMIEGNDTWVQSSWKLPDWPSSSLFAFPPLGSCWALRLFKIHFLNL